MPKYQIQVHGTGLLVTAKKISFEQAQFWKELRYNDLTNYLYQGDEGFDDFPIPESAKFSGGFAEEEIDLQIEWNHSCLFSDVKFEQIYGPKVNLIDRIDLIRIDNKNEIIFSIENPILKNFHLPNSPDDEVNVFLVEAENNLLFFESEKGQWTYEADVQHELKNIEDFKIVATHCSFNEEIDSIVDDVCTAIVASGHIFMLVDSDTDTLGSMPMIYQE
jgi:hypothetical protein